MNRTRFNEDGDEELGFPGLLTLALVVLVVSWISFLVASAYLD